MGRQIQIVSIWADELAILEHLATQSEIRIFRSIANSRKGLWIEDWRESEIQESRYSIWPTHFPWTPSYRQIKKPCVPGVEGQWYIENRHVGPVIEFSRHMHRAGSPGRLYWSKYFSATEPLGYDVEEFDRLVSALWRYVRKNGVRDIVDPHKPFVLPKAIINRG